MNFETLQHFDDIEIFSSEERMGRKKYFFYSTAIPLILFWSFSTLLDSIGGTSPLLSALFGAIIASTMIIIVRLSILRCHDFNASGWYAVLSLIPLASIIFALIPGNNGINSYGEAAEPASKLVANTSIILAIALIAMSLYMATQYLPVL